MANWWESAPVVEDTKPSDNGDWWKSAPLAEEVAAPTVESNASPTPVSFQGQPQVSENKTEPNLIRDVLSSVARGSIGGYQSAAEGAHRILARASYDPERPVNTPSGPNLPQAQITEFSEPIATLDLNQSTIVPARGFPKVAGYLNQTADISAEQRKSVREALPVSKEFENSIMGGIAEGVGQLSMIPLYGVPGVGPATTVSQVFQEGYDDAIRSGATPEQASSAAQTYAMTAGPLEFAADKILVGRFLKGVEGSTVKDVIASIVKQGAQEGATEGAQQAILNGIAKELEGYDPNRKLDEGVIESLVVGAAIGGIGGGAATGLGALNQSQQPELPPAPALAPSPDPVVNQTEIEILGKANEQFAPPAVSAPIADPKQVKMGAQVLDEVKRFSKNPTKQTWETVMGREFPELKGNTEALNSLYDASVGEYAVQTGQKPSRGILAQTNPTPEVVVEPVTAPPTGDERFAPGAYVPNQVTSIKNDVVDVGRERRGLPPKIAPLREAWGEVWNEVENQVAADPAIGERLIAELAQKPRATRNATETAILQRQVALREAEYDNAVDAVNNAENSIDREAAKEELKIARSRIQEAFDAADSSGTESARAFNARKMMVDKEKFTLARMEKEYRARANDGLPLTDTQADEVKVLHDKIAELQKKLDATETRLSNVEAETYFEALIKVSAQEARANAKAGRSVSQFLSEQANAARERIKARGGRLMTGLDPLDLADHAIIGADYIAQGITKAADFTTQLVKDFGESIRPFSEQIFKKSKEYRDSLAKVHSATTVPPEERKRKTYLKMLENRTRKWNERAEKGDFAKPVREIKRLDKEVLDAKFRLEEAKKKWNEGLLDQERKRRTVSRKAVDTAGETLQFSRNLITSLDLSAVGRQGLVATLSNPVKATRAMGAMFRSMLSQKNEFQINEEIRNRDNYPLYKQAGLALTVNDANANLTQQEEEFAGRWIHKLPRAVGGGLLRGSQRAYTTFLNRMRADVFDGLVNSMKVGDNPLTLSEAKALANYVNVATGRGDFGKFNGAVAGLNKVFWAPRLMKARVDYLTGQPVRGGSSRTKKIIAKEYAKTLTGAALVMALAGLAGATIEYDPRSSDFLKARFGDTRLDLLGGFSQYITLLSRLTTGDTKNSKGKVQSLQKDYLPRNILRATGAYPKKNAPQAFKNDPGIVTLRFARSKANPVLGTVADVALGQNVVGEEVTPTSAATNLLIPLSIRDIQDTMGEQGIPAGTAMSLLNIFGVGVNTYDPNEKKK